ncbi:AaceriAAR018Wp [[Ashbya] aceris (nom. inval.)]|nr:AaceriAAR018Wp [[Ashbya] aceris (nom. inval.)]
MPSLDEGSQNSSRMSQTNSQSVECAVPSSVSSAGNGGPSMSDMQYYYQHLYPFRPIFHWLNHSPKPQRDMVNRELAMAFRSGAYKRYNSFSSVQEFKQQIQKANPDRFEIGAVYNKPPRDRDSVLKTEMKPLEKELVFDIDMDDYDDYRTCCSGAQVCDKCWKFIFLAMKVMNTSLVEDFGLEQFIWVFSGRRGAHCWISDPRARSLSDVQRKSVLDYMNVVRDRNSEKRISFTRPYHPHLARSLNILKPYFVDFILREQDPWQDDNAAVRLLLPAIQDGQLADQLKKHWKENPGRSSEEKWKDIDLLASSMTKQAKRPDYLTRLREAKEDLILAILYPKLDVEVTKQTIHLLKAPFCIHPATGNVCVPITEDFSPTSVPKLIQLQHEMESNGNKVEQTSLQPYIEAFSRHVSVIVKAELAFRKRNHPEGEDIPEF